ncbi:MAG: HAD hydrolase family protein, partial [Myxococcota bacterium]
KADLLQTIALTERVHLDQIIAVGDGANDLDMLDRAGLGIAFHAKPKVKLQAPHCLDQPRMDAIFYLMGLSAPAIEQITKGSDRLSAHR